MVRKQISLGKVWILLSPGFLNLCHRTLLVFSRSICSYIWKTIANNAVLKEIISSAPRLALNSWPSTFSLLNAEVVDMPHAWLAYFLALPGHVTLRPCLLMLLYSLSDGSVLNWQMRWLCKPKWRFPAYTKSWTWYPGRSSLCLPGKGEGLSLYKTGSSATSEPRLIMTKIWTPEVDKCDKRAG